MKQKAPQSFDEAVAATLELESYKTMVAVVELKSASEDSATVGAESGNLATLIKKLVDQVEKPELATMLLTH